MTKDQNISPKLSQRVRGTRDLLPEEKKAFRFVESLALKISSKYGYQEMETPIFEFSEVFHRTLGETSDVVNKETYTFLDRGGDSITLRPEGTAGIARAFISEGLAQHIPLKYFYSGPMFRYERPQKGRFRQFYQIGVESLGLESHVADIECITMAWDFLCGLKLNEICKLEINTLGDQQSRTAYREALVKYFTQFKSELSQESQIRLEKNPLRILDSKDEKDKKFFSNAPKLTQYLNEESKRFFESVLSGLSQLKIPYEVNPHIVRGLDYYSHTVFEFTTQTLGAQGTVLAGGRYDGLIESMGGPHTPGVGWAAGIDRLAEITPKNLYTVETPLIAIIAADTMGENESIPLSHELRTNGFVVENILTGSNVGKKMKRANKVNAYFAIIIGQSEVDQKIVSLKNLKTGEQKNIPRSELVKHLKSQLK